MVGMYSQGARWDHPPNQSNPRPSLWPAKRQRNEGGNKEESGAIQAIGTKYFRQAFIFLTGTQVTFYVDKISILYYQLSRTLIVFQGCNHLQIMSYMHILALKLYFGGKAKSGRAVAEFTALSPIYTALSHCFPS